MLQDMDNTEASCVFYVMVGMFTHLEQSKTSRLTVNKTAIVRLPVQHDLTVSIRFLYHPGNSSRHTSADVLSLKQCHIYSRHSSNFGCNTLQFLPLNNQTMSDRHIAHLGAVRYPSNLRLYTAGSSLSITNVLATNYAILT
jgi:hypothetical protein